MHRPLGRCPEIGGYPPADEGERVKVSTWVRRDDGAVMCQEATLDRTTWMPRATKCSAP